MYSYAASTKKPLSSNWIIPMAEQTKDWIIPRAKQNSDWIINKEQTITWIIPQLISLQPFQPIQSISSVPIQPIQPIQPIISVPNQPIISVPNQPIQSIQPIQPIISFPWDQQLQPIVKFQTVENYDLFGMSKQQIESLNQTQPTQNVICGLNEEKSMENVYLDVLEHVESRVVVNYNKEKYIPIYSEKIISHAKCVGLTSSAKSLNMNMKNHIQKKEEPIIKKEEEKVKPAFVLPIKREIKGLRLTSK